MLALVCAGCPADGDAADGAEGSSTGTSTGAMTGTMTSSAPTTDPSPSTTAPPATDSTGEPSASTGSDSSDSGSDSSGDSSGSGSGSSSSTGEPEPSTGTSTGGEMSQACAEGCAVEYDCGQRWPSLEACTTWCNDNLEEAALLSDFCRIAWEQLSACLGTLDCTEFEQWQSPVAFPYPCSTPDEALVFECEGQ